MSIVSEYEVEVVDSLGNEYRFKQLILPWSALIDVKPKFKQELPLNRREIKESKRKKEASWDMNKLQPRKTKVIGSDINLDDYDIVGHLISDTVFKCPELNWSHFDWVQLIQKTNHPQVNRPRFHFLGFRSGQTSILICKHK